jgi:hypothetical protein
VQINKLVLTTPVVSPFITGTDVTIFKIFSQKNCETLAFLAQNKAKLCREL